MRDRHDKEESSGGSTQYILNDLARGQQEMVQGQQQLVQLLAALMRTSGLLPFSWHLLASCQHHIALVSFLCIPPARGHGGLPICNILQIPLYV